MTANPPEPEEVVGPVPTPMTLTGDPARGELPAT